MFLNIYLQQFMALSAYICFYFFSSELKPYGVEGAGLVSSVGDPLDASFGFYLREAFQSQTNTEKIL